MTKRRSKHNNIFRVNDKKDVSKNSITHFGKVLKDLDIELICANSPQAKGRVERANRILQDRLIKEMRLKNISNIDQANEYLEEFRVEHNKKFEKQPRYKQNAKKYEYVKKEIYNCYFNQNFAKGLRIVTKTKDKFPENGSKITLWIACFLALLGENEKALEALEEGIKHGAWWPRNLPLSEQDIKELRKHPRLLNFAEFLSNNR